MMFEALVLAIALGHQDAQKPADELALILPPPQYWHEPEIPVVVHERHAIRAGFRHVAVTPPLQRRLTGVCHVYVNPAMEQVNPLAYRAILFHEVYGHCNGWPADHPGKGEGYEIVDLDAFLTQYGF